MNWKSMRKKHASIGHHTVGKFVSVRLLKILARLVDRIKLEMKVNLGGENIIEDIM